MREQDSRSYPVREDMRLQNVFWATERVVWALLGAIVLLALSGIFAHGPLGERTVGDGALSLSYERFQRHTALSRLTVRMAAPNPGEASLRFGPSLLDNFQIADIEPRPLRSSAGTGGLELVFLPPATGDLAIVIWAYPRSFGVFDLTAAADPQSRVAFSILVYP
jgi:hypothetical protein